MEEFNQAHYAIGAMIKQYRKKLKMTQYKLADLVGVNRVTITNIERGKGGTSIDNLYKISEVLGVSIHDIIPVNKKPKFRLKVKTDLTIF